MSLAAAIAQVQTYVSALPGIKSAPTDPPESANQFPFSVTYAVRGSFNFESAGWGIGLHQIVTEVHLARQSLPQAVAQALPYFESFVDVLIANPTLNDTVTTLNLVEYQFGRLEYGGVETIGWVFTLSVKLLRG